jgi:hypothetical protein
MGEFLGDEPITVGLEDGREEQEPIHDHLSRWHHFVAKEQWEAENYWAIHDMMHFSDEKAGKEQDHTHSRADAEAP